MLHARALYQLYARAFIWRLSKTVVIWPRRAQGLLDPMEGFPDRLVFFIWQLSKTAVLWPKRPRGLRGPTVGAGLVES